MLPEQEALDVEHLKGQIEDLIGVLSGQPRHERIRQVEAEYGRR